MIDGAGVAAITLGVAYTLIVFGLRRDESQGVDRLRHYRQGIGRAILLGLKFLVAADIIRTVAVSPTFRSVVVLVIIVAVRTFLSFTLELELELELEGLWPWQQLSGHAPKKVSS
ncbi:MAG: DUF1622 domain-containing protein [Gaiellaceae bacterium]